jgi:hypothetical protein
MIPDGIKRHGQVVEMRRQGPPLRPDFLSEVSLPAAMLADLGMLVTVPAPARFAVHGFLVAQDCPATLVAKVKQDLAQSAALSQQPDELRPEYRPAALAVARRRQGRGQLLRRALAARVASTARVPYASDSSMSERVDLADPDFEPTDEQLQELSRRAFAQVKARHDEAMDRLSQQIAEASAATMKRFEERIARVRFGV